MWCDYRDKTCPGDIPTGYIDPSIGPMDECAFSTANEPEITITKKLIFVGVAPSTNNMFCCDLCHDI